MGVVEAENDVFGGVDFIENFDHEIFDFALGPSGGDETRSVKSVDLTIFEVAGNLRVGVHEGFGEGID